MAGDVRLIRSPISVAGLVRDEFRPHRGVACLAAELDRVHVLDAAVRTERDDDDVRDRQTEDDDGGRPLRRIVEIDRRPLNSRRRFPGGAPPPFDPGPEWNQQEANHEQPGQDEEKDDADVRVRVKAEHVRQEHDQERHGTDRGQHHAGDRDRAPNQAKVSGMRLLLFHC